MLEKKKEYINQLIVELSALQSRVQFVQNEEALPFSFFREAFDKTEAITRVLHELELLQIEDMKLQMEKLVRFLSENNSQTEKRDAEELLELLVEEAPVSDNQLFEGPKMSSYNSYSEGVILPEYKNPRATDIQSATPPELPKEEEEEFEAPVIRSFNDTIGAPPAVLDLKRGLSLNDRFLFQRELFNNDRHEMNSMMLKLNAFTQYDDAENYLRENTSWDFENQTVKEFLLAIKKGMA